MKTNERKDRIIELKRELDKLENEPKKYDVQIWIWNVPGRTAQEAAKKVEDAIRNCGYITSTGEVFEIDEQ